MSHVAVSNATGDACSDVGDLLPPPSLNGDSDDEASVPTCLSSWSDQELPRGPGEKALPLGWTSFRAVDGARYYWHPDSNNGRPQQDPPGACQTTEELDCFAAVSDPEQLLAAIELCAQDVQLHGCGDERVMAGELPKSGTGCTTRAAPQNASLLGRSPLEEPCTDGPWGPTVVDRSGLAWSPTPSAMEPCDGITESHCTMHSVSEFQAPRAMGPWGPAVVDKRGIAWSPTPSAMEPCDAVAESRLTNRSASELEAESQSLHHPRPRMPHNVAQPPQTLAPEQVTVLKQFMSDGIADIQLRPGLHGTILKYACESNVCSELEGKRHLSKLDGVCGHVPEEHMRSGTITELSESHMQSRTCRAAHAEAELSELHMQSGSIQNIWHEDIVGLPPLVEDVDDLPPFGTVTV